MPLDVDMERVLNALAARGFRTLDQFSIQRLRALSAQLRVPDHATVRIERREMPGPGGVLQLTIYRPLESAGWPGALVFFPAGGYVLSAAPGHSALCGALSVGGECVVVSVQHRLAPEQRFPAAVDDAYAATCWIHEQADELMIDHERIAIGGHSSGATLATAVARLAKERRNPPLIYQLLLEPLCDLRTHSLWTAAPDTHAGILSADNLRWLAGNYVASAEQLEDPRCSPITSKNLIGLPTALIASAEFDPLREQTEAYVAALRLAHVDVTTRVYPGVTHGFLGMHTFVERGRLALADCQAALRRALAARA